MIIIKVNRKMEKLNESKNIKNPVVFHFFFSLISA